MLMLVNCADATSTVPRAATKEKSLFMEEVLIVNRFSTNIHGHPVRAPYENMNLNGRARVPRPNFRCMEHKDRKKPEQVVRAFHQAPRGPRNFNLFLDDETLNTESALIAQHHVVRACAEMGQVDHCVSLQRLV